MDDADTRKSARTLRALGALLVFLTLIGIVMYAVWASLIGPGQTASAAGLASNNTANMTATMSTTVPSTSSAPMPSAPHTSVLTIAPQYPTHAQIVARDSAAQASEPAALPAEATKSPTASSSPRTIDTAHGTIDDCPAGDFSGNADDGSCGTAPSSQPVDPNQNAIGACQLAIGGGYAKVSAPVQAPSVWTVIFTVGDRTVQTSGAGNGSAVAVVGPFSIADAPASCTVAFG